MNKLYECKICGKPVAMDAETCPHCGTRSPVPAFTAVKIISNLLLLGIFALFHKQ